MKLGQRIDLLYRFVYRMPLRLRNSKLLNHSWNFLFLWSIAWWSSQRWGVGVEVKTVKIIHSQLCSKLKVGPGLKQTKKTDNPNGLSWPKVKFSCLLIEKLTSLYSVFCFVLF